MKIPGKIIQGDTVTWEDGSVSNTPYGVIDSSWTLTWFIAGPTVLSVVSVASAAGWKTTLTTAQTAALTATTGAQPNYSWQAVATKAGVTVTLGMGQLTVSPSLANAVAGFDGRSQAERDLEAVQSAIRARVSGGVIEEYTIGTRRLRNEPVAELMKLETRLKLVVSKERRARMIKQGLGDPRNTFVRF